MSNVPSDKSTMEKAALSLGWASTQWATLLSGSPVDSAALFEHLMEQMEDKVQSAAHSEAWPLRFAALSTPWRGFAAALDSARLSELLSGNLSGDDSGIAQEYVTEREALRMLCALRIFRESSLGMGEPDPKINSLRRIKLGRWREYPQVGAPGFSPDKAQRRGFATAGLARLLAALSADSMASCSIKAVVACSGAAMVASCAAAFASWHWQGSLALSMCAFAAPTAALLNGWTLGLARRASCKALGERALGLLGLGPSSRYEMAASLGLADAARASGLDAAIEYARQVEQGQARWADLGAEERKAINRRRSKRSKSSLEEAGPWLAESERDCLRKSLATSPSSPGGLSELARDKSRAKRL